MSSHILYYRAEIAALLFDLLRGGESAAIVGSASMGKSRLLLFLQRADVQQHYLGEAAAHTVLLPTDCNRLAEKSDWGLYELLLTALIEGLGSRLPAATHEWLNALRREAITGRNALLAQRHLELATHTLCRDHGLRLCFLLDEFDESYRTLPATALANLRALRDADRYQVCFVLLMRDHPGRLRTREDSEGFYELLSRSVLGLKPYRDADARQVIAQIAARRGRAWREAEIATMLRLSGGHPGSLVALSDALTRQPLPAEADAQLRWALAQPALVEEFRKLWQGLAEDERLALSRLAQGIGAPYTLREVLALKGLIRDENREQPIFFSPAFHQYVLDEGVLSASALWLDEAAAVVWVEGKRIEDLSKLEYELLRLLYRRLGQVCSRDDILSALYPTETLDEDHAGSENRIDSLVRHLRRAIEPDARQPRYLLTVRGHGYRLVDTPAPLE
ncbi:MAG: winged helix-turn-helix domain-containing protein [Anaerolineae bacterium]